MKVLGLDPGLSGAAAIIAAAPDSRPRLVEVIDLPTTGEKAKRRIDVWPLIQFIATHAPDFAVIERAQAMPDQGSSSGFIYGRAVGAIEACVIGLSVPMTIIESTAWKKFHSLIGTQKEDSRQRAILRFPDGRDMIARKLDHNRAEAILMAEFGLALVRNKQAA